jgi:hypothetical protein
MDNIFSSLNGLSFNPEFSASLTPEMSAAIQNILDQTNLTLTLSALNTLSSIPLHPYDRLKYDVYGPEYKDIKFKTIDEVPIPTNFTPEEMLQGVINKTQSIQRTLLENIDRSPEQFTNTILNTVSGDKITPNVDMHKKHIEFVELIRQIPVSAELTNQQILDYSKKIISEFVKTY